MAFAYIWCLAFVTYAVIGQTVDASCGRAGSDLGYRVIGGKRAGNCQYPWMVKLKVITAQEGNKITFLSCGGSILDSTHILTAAHCLVVKEVGSTIYTPLASNVRVIAGSATADSDPIVASKYKLHESYYHVTLENDIAIITLSEPITFDKCHEPICLPNRYQKAVESSGCLVMGWGLTATRGNSSPVLLYTGVTVESSGTSCYAKYTGYNNAAKMCVPGSRTGTCQGDSGGPLVCPSEDGRYIQYGVVSGGGTQECATEPTVFTRVTQYLSWIEENRSN